MHGLKRWLRNTDWWLLISCTTAAIYGILLIASADASGAGGNPTMQALCLVVGIGFAVAVSSVDYHLLCRYRFWPAVFTLLLMGLTFTPLGYEVPGTDDRNWLQISLGERQILLQPSELLKILFIVTFSYHLVACRKKPWRSLALAALGVHAAIPVLLVFLQGDDGNAFVIAALCLLLLILGGLPLRYLLIAAVPATAAMPLIWRYMDDDKRARFLCLFKVEEYQQTVGWQQELSVTAIGAGGRTGVGYGQGGEHQLYARQNDFIFTVAGEELGFVGTLAVLLLITAVLLCLYRSAKTAADPLGRLLCGGLFSLIAVQAVVNIGMTLRLMPVLGITLPFFSAGGSSLLTLFCGVGIAMSVYRHRRPYRLF